MMMTIVVVLATSNDEYNDDDDNDVNDDDDDDDDDDRAVSAVFISPCLTTVPDARVLSTASGRSALGLVRSCYLATECVNPRYSAHSLPGVQIAATLAIDLLLCGTQHYSRLQLRDNVGHFAIIVDVHDILVVVVLNGEDSLGINAFANVDDVIDGLGNAESNVGTCIIAFVKIGDGDEDDNDNYDVILLIGEGNVGFIAFVNVDDGDDDVTFAAPDTRVLEVVLHVMLMSRRWKRVSYLDTLSPLPPTRHNHVTSLT
ncbi:hypothetical protein ElyMa_000975500 [Elysia marginata]|uniref:Uncharacterized protein n=1 Tax=Elysia marginata TaxID=1093978 RepID=A0AAV4HEQ7_9GAST|nr:hypothetical protein ElyMa_000975500 [Elysia marginata]